jgi:hypothetical protein
VVLFVFKHTVAESLANALDVGVALLRNIPLQRNSGKSLPYNEALSGTCMVYLWTHASGVGASDTIPSTIQQMRPLQELCRV